MRPIRHAAGGTSAAAVAALYDWLEPHVTPERPSLLSDTVLLAAPTRGEFDEIRARITESLDGVDVIDGHLQSDLLRPRHHHHESPRRDLGCHQRKPQSQRRGPRRIER